MPNNIEYFDPMSIGNNKYEVIAVSNDDYTNDHALHKLIIGSKLHKKISDKEKIHYVDFDEHNDDPENVIILDNSDQYDMMQKHLVSLLVQCMPKDDLRKITMSLKNIIKNVGPNKRLILSKLPHRMPLYDNHSHLGGSIEPEIVAAILAKRGKNIRIGKVRKSMTYQGKKPDNFNAFIKKFDMLNQVKWTEEDIYDSVHQVVSKIDVDGVECSEMRFSIDKYRPYLKMTDVDIIRLIRAAFDDASEYFNVKVNLVLSFSHGVSKKNLAVARRIDKYADCVVGIDISGNEKKFDVKKFIPIYDIWDKNDKTLMAHVGEQPGTSGHVTDAIKKLKVTRIAHGIYSDKYTLDMAKDLGICFDLAISSNYYTGVVKHMHAHPALKMLNNGNIITIGTDDASVFCTSLRKEYALAKEHWCLTDSDLNRLKLNAIEYSTFDCDFGL